MKTMNSYDHFIYEFIWFMNLGVPRFQMWGGTVAVVMGDMRRPSPLPQC